MPVMPDSKSDGGPTHSGVRYYSEIDRGNCHVETNYLWYTIIICGTGAKLRLVTVSTNSSYPVQDIVVIYTAFQPIFNQPLLYTRWNFAFHQISSLTVLLASTTGMEISYDSILRPQSLVILPVLIWIANIEHWTFSTTWHVHSICNRIQCSQDIFHTISNSLQPIT